MNKNFKTRLIAWAIPLAVGGLATLLSGGMDSYKVMNQPPLSPPAWVFPVVWTVLYLLMLLMAVVMFQDVWKLFQ